MCKQCDLVIEELHQVPNLAQLDLNIQVTPISWVGQGDEKRPSDELLQSTMAETAEFTQRQFTSTSITIAYQLCPRSVRESHVYIVIILD